MMDSLAAIKGKDLTDHYTEDAFVALCQPGMVDESNGQFAKCRPYLLALYQRARQYESEPITISEVLVNRQVRPLRLGQRGAISKFTYRQKLRWINEALRLQVLDDPEQLFLEGLFLVDDGLGWSLMRQQRKPLLAFKKCELVAITVRVCPNSGNSGRAMAQAELLQAVYLRLKEVGRIREIGHDQISAILLADGSRQAAILAAKAINLALELRSLSWLPEFRLQVGIDMGEAQLLECDADYVGYPVSVKRAADLAGAHHRPKDWPSLDQHDQSTVRILTTPAVHNAVPNAFYTEPGEDPEHKPIHRIWSASRRDEASLSLPPDAPWLQGKMEPQQGFSDTHWAVAKAAVAYRLRRVLVTEEAEIGPAAQLVLSEVRGLLPEARVLHWIGHKSRSYDLLQPIIETLRNLLNLNRLSSSVGLEDQIGQELRNLWPNGDRISDDWVRTTRNVLAVLCGGANDSDFSRAVDVVAKVLEECARGSQPMVIVVEDLAHIDELTQRLIYRLATSTMRGLCLKVIVVVRRDEAKVANQLLAELLPLCPARNAESTAEAPSVSRRPMLPQDGDALHALRLAALLGWSFPRCWLRILWRSSTTGANSQELEPPRAQREFEPVLARLLEAGYLRYSGCFADLNQPYRYRELSFTSRTIFDLALEEAKRMQPLFEGLFAKELQKSVAQAKGSIDGIRRKIQVCRALKDWQPETFHERRSLVSLWLHVAKRARVTRAQEQTRWRADQACRLVLQNSASDTSDVHPGLEDDAAEILAIGVSVASDSKVTPATRRLLSQSTLFFASLKSGAARASWKCRFALARSLWAWHERWDDLATALQFAEEMPNLIENDEKARRKHFLQLEIQHILSVVNFGIGRLVECRDAGHKGAILCEDQNRSQHDDSLLFGSHDGGGCCKVYRALSQLLLAETEDARQSLEVATKYASRSTTDSISQRIVHTYGLLYQLLRQDYAQVGIAHAELQPSSPEATPEWIVRLRAALEDRWEIMRMQLIMCAGIGIRWQECPGLPEGESLTVMKDEIGKFLEGLEYLCDLAAFRDLDTVWLTYQAMAQALSGQVDSALTLFDRAINVAEERSEFVFLPEIYRHRAQLQWWLHREQQCEDDLICARYEAAHSDTHLFVNRALDDLKRLGLDDRDELPEEYRNRLQRRDEKLAQRHTWLPKT